MQCFAEIHTEQNSNELNNKWTDDKANILLNLYIENKSQLSLIYNKNINLANNDIIGKGIINVG